MLRIKHSAHDPFRSIFPDPEDELVPDDPDDPEVMPALEDMSYTYTTPVPPITSPPQIRLPSLDTPDDPYAIFNDDADVLPARPGLIPMPIHTSDTTMLDPQRAEN